MEVKPLMPKPFSSRTFAISRSTEAGASTNGEVPKTWRAQDTAAVRSNIAKRVTT